MVTVTPANTVDVWTEFALIVPCPADRPVTKPLELTLMRDGLSECHVTLWSTWAELPALLNTAAES